VHPKRFHLGSISSGNKGYLKMSRKNMMLVISGSALGLSSVAIASPDLDRAYAAELRADAAAHTSLLQAGGSGHDGSFFIGDGAGNNRMEIGGLLQFRYIFNTRDSDDAGVTSTEDTINGFDAHRVQLDFSGNVVSPNWEYAIGLEFGQADTGVNGNTANIAGNLRHAFITYNFEGDGAGTSVSVGQFKSPVVWEDAASDSTMLSVERSAVNEFFSGGYTQGVALDYTADEFMLTVALHDGIGFQPAGGTGTGPGTALSPIGGSDADFAIAARFDYKIEGDWAQFADATSWKGSNNAFRLGGGINWQSGGSTGRTFATGATPDLDYILWTVDGRYEGNGWNVGAAVVGNSWDDSDSGIDANNTGIVVDGGVFLSDDVEVFGRYDYIDIDSSLVTATSEDSAQFFTIGGNYYLTPESHAAKITVDFIYSFEDAVAFTTGANPFGDMGILGGSDTEYAFRGQLQLGF